MIYDNTETAHGQAGACTDLKDYFKPWLLFLFDVMVVNPLACSEHKQKESMQSNGYIACALQRAFCNTYL